MISIIITTYNEEQKIEKLLDNLHQLPCKHGKELIVSDGGSTDNTIEATNNKVRIIIGKRGKAFQMNKAALAAWGDILFFVHGDMTLTNNTLLAIEEVIYKERFDGGGFVNIFDQDKGEIKRNTNMINFRSFHKQKQSDKGVFYEDNGIFIKKTAFEKLEGFKEIMIMEDYDFSTRATQQFKLKKIKNPVITVSAKRSIPSSFIKSHFLWIIIRLLYKTGIFPFILAKWYALVR